MTMPNPRDLAGEEQCRKILNKGVRVTVGDETHAEGIFRPLQRTEDVIRVKAGHYRLDIGLYEGIHVKVKALHAAKEII